MADDNSHVGNPDRQRIQDYEVRDWSHKLGVTEAELTAAVRHVGNDADAVRKLLRKTWT